MSDNQITGYVEELQRLLSERLRVRGRDLGQQLDRAGRLLPRAVRREARYLADSARIAPNPKLAKMIDAARADRAFEAVKAHLEGIDPKARARARLLNWLAVLGFNVLLIAGLVIWWLWATGRV